MLICSKGANTVEIYKIYRRMIHFLPIAAYIPVVQDGDISRVLLTIKVNLDF